MRRIAFLGRGVHTIPTYRAMLNRLSKDFDITVFCETPIEPSWHSYQKQYRLVSACVRFLPFNANAVLFFISVLWHHLIRRYDVIHAHSTYPTGLTAVLLQRMLRVPSVVSLDGGEGISLPGISFGDLPSSTRTSINKWVLSRAAVVNTLTNFHRTLIERNLNLSHKILVIPRGVEYNESEIQTNDQIAKPVRLLFVGYLSPIKDPVTLIKAFRIIQQTTPATLTVVGRDYMEGEIQKLALAGNLTIDFAGHVDHHHITDFYKNADILLVTSLYESQGMAVAEAMAAGVLVCGTNVGLVNDLADDCCVSVPVGDAAGLARRVIELIGDANERRRMQMKAKQWSSDFSLTHTVERWTEIYVSLIEKR